MSVRCFMVPKFHSYRFSLIKNRVCVFSLFIESAYLFQIRVGIKDANNTKDSFTFVCTWEFDKKISGSIPKKTQGIAVVILVRAPSEANKKMNAIRYKRGITKNLIKAIIAIKKNKTDVKSIRTLVPWKRPNDEKKKIPSAIRAGLDPIVIRIK